MDQRLNRQAKAICEIAGCEFTEEDSADFEKVARGELSNDDIREKAHERLTKLKKEHPEKFDQSSQK